MSEERDSQNLLEEAYRLRVHLTENHEVLVDTINIFNYYSTQGKRLYDGYYENSAFLHKVLGYMWISAREAKSLNSSLLETVDFALIQKADVKKDVDALAAAVAKFDCTVDFDKVALDKLKRLENIVLGYEKDFTLEQLKNYLNDCAAQEDASTKVLNHDRFYLTRHTQMIEQIVDKNCNDVCPFILTVNNKPKTGIIR